MGPKRQGILRVLSHRQWVFNPFPFSLFNLSPSQPRPFSLEKNRPSPVGRDLTLNSEDARESLAAWFLSLMGSAAPLGQQEEQAGFMLGS